MLLIVKASPGFVLSNVHAARCESQRYDKPTSKLVDASCSGWFDMRDLGAVLDHEDLPHSAGDQAASSAFTCPRDVVRVGTMDGNAPAKLARITGPRWAACVA
jgi:hypothetical protein